MEKVSFNVLSCCISRDSLDYNALTGCFGSDKYAVNKYVTFISPYSLNSGKEFNLPDDIFINSGLSNFRKRNKVLDACNGAINYLCDEKSDYLLLDVGECREKIAIYDNQNIYLTLDPDLEKILPMVNKILGDEPKIYSYWQLDLNELLTRLQFIVKKLLNTYSADEIILNKFYSVDEYVDSAGSLKKFSIDEPWTIWATPKYNSLFEKLNHAVESIIQGCHIIPALPNVIADEKHRWGLSPLHYHNLYYEYAEKCIDIITQKLERSEEEQQIEFLRQLYSEKFATLREKALCNNVRADRAKWRTYEETIKTLIVNGFLDNNCNVLQKIFLAKGYKHIAIYGDTEITKVLCKILEDTEVAIDYIVENAAKPINGIKTINRSDTQYPYCDIMLIADIYYYNEIKAKLEKMKVSFPFYNAAEFIKSLPVAGDA